MTQYQNKMKRLLGRPLAKRESEVTKGVKSKCEG